MSGPVDREGIPELCRQVGLLLKKVRADLVECDVSAIVDPDAVTVDALARLQLTARRMGGRVRILDACPELRELLDLMGLQDVVPVMVGSGVESRGQPEEREQAGGVEEEGDAADLPP